MQENNKFEDKVKALFSTIEGKAVLAELKQLYVDRSCFSELDTYTAYQLGQSELVKELISITFGKGLKSDEELMDLQDKMFD